MDEAEIFSNLRSRIGNPTPNEYSDIDLQKTMEPHLCWFASEMGMPIIPALTLPLTADEYSIALPQDCDQLLWVEWNGKRLEPASINRWVRDGVTWRQDASNEPRSYAVQDRKIILNPPPSSDAISTDANLTIAYVGVTAELSATGIAGLTDGDLWCVILRTAADFLGLHPGKNDQETAQRKSLLTTNLAMFSDMIKQAKARRQMPVKTRGAKRFRVGGRPWLPAK